LLITTIRAGTNQNLASTGNKKVPLLQTKTLSLSYSENAGSSKKHIMASEYEVLKWGGHFLVHPVEIEGRIDVSSDLNNAI